MSMIFVPQWSAIARLGQSWIAKSAYFWLAFVPIAVVVSSKLASVVHIRFWDYDWQLMLKLPFSWQVLFYASLSASIANLIFSMYCPEIIREYRDYKQFKERSDSIHKIMRMLNDAFIALSPESKNYNEVAYFCMRFLSLGRPDIEHFTKLSETEYYREPELRKVAEASILKIFALPQTSATQYSNHDAFEFVRGFADTIRPLARSLAVTFYAITFVLLGFLVCQNVWAVLTYRSQI